MTRHRLAVAGAGIAATLLTLLGTAPAHAATTSYTVGTDPVQVAAGWLTTQFVDASKLPAPAGDHFISGEFGGQFFVNYGENADVVFALAAAKSGGSAISKATDYLAANVDAYGDISNSDGFGPSDGAIGKMALAAIVAGRDPSSFGGFDLLHTLKSDECPAASTTCTPGSPKNIFSSISASFDVLAEARAGGSNAPDGALLTYFTSLQCASGGFSSGTDACGSGSADIDATSYAIMALAAAGGHDADVAKAVTWLSGQENAGHYWVAQGGPSVNSTGLAATALASRGADESAAQAWLRSQQIGAGHSGAGALLYQGVFTPTVTTATSPSVLATAQAIPALVSGASLATVSATGAATGATLLAPTATLSASSAKAGAAGKVTGHGFVAGESVSAVLHSTPVTLGSARAAADGTVTVSYTVPSGAAAGAHTVVLTGATSGLAASGPLTVSASSTGGTSTGSTGGSTGSAQGETGTGHEPIAATGQNRRALLGLGAGGALAVIVGAGLLVFARRRIS